MKIKKLFFAILSCLVQFFIYYCLNSAALPLSCSLFTAMALGGGGIIPSTAAFFVSFVRYGTLPMFFNAALTAVITVGLYAVYRKNDKKPGAEMIFFIFLSNAPYLAFHDGKIVDKLVYTAIIVVFYFVCQIAVGAVKYKNFIATAKTYESLAIAVCYAVCSYQTVRCFGFDLFKSISFFIVLFAVSLYKSPTALIVACVSALPPSLAQNNLGYFALYVAAFFAAYLFKNGVSFFPALAVTLVDAAFAYLINFYPVYGYIEGLFALIPCVLFSFIPASVFDKIRNAGFVGRERTAELILTRIKSALSGKLYDLSQAFSEAEGALAALGANGEQTDVAVKKICRIARENACQNCANRDFCSVKDGEDLAKLVRLGLSKGRVTLVDLPKQTLDQCVNPNPLIFEVNRLIDAYSQNIESAKKTEDVKKLLAISFGGIKERLSKLAYEVNLSMPRDQKTESAIYEKLAQSGIRCFGVAVCGDEKKTYQLIVKNNANEKALSSFIEEFSGKRSQIVEKQPLAEGLKYLEISPCPPLQVTFGVSSVKKNGSTYSGDSHSVIMLDENRVLVALSDGMGSGRSAMSTSVASIGAIEGMLKAGLETSVVLPIVNKIISICTEDNFSAMDMGVIDLKNGRCDFVKIGAPYGFILSSEGIRLVEGSSLPIGILSELRPTTAYCGIRGGDMLVMLSDGVTDAFASSSDFIEFLKTAPQKNPQTLADSIIDRALRLCSGVAADDMTALCVRLYEVKAD